MASIGRRLVAALLCCCASLLASIPDSRAAKPLRVLATTYPLYQLTRNVAAGVAGIAVELMIPAELGCPHDYTLTPQDMRKLAAADVLIVNGLGLEEFLGAPVQRAHPGIRIIDSSRDVAGILPSSGEEPDHGKDHDHAPGPNPHLFASPRMSALLTENIARGLAGLRPEAAASLLANGRAYASRLNLLADDLAALGRRLANNRIVAQHGVFDYLARDMGLRVVAVIQAHGGQDPSAAEILKLTADIRAHKAGALFTEPQYPEAIGKVIAREASIPAARLDPGANGPESAPLDAYEQIMRANLRTIEQTLGTR